MRRSNKKLPVGRRSLLKAAGAGVLGSTLGIGASGQEEKDGVGAASSHEFRLENAELYMDVSTNTGKFRLWTADNQALLYPADYTSYMTVRVDGELYDTSGQSANFMGDYFSSGPTKTGSASSETSWNLPELAVDREISLDGEAARFTVTVTNDDDTAHDVDMRYLFDYQVDDQDGAPVFVQGNVYTNERRFESPSFTQNLTYDRIPDPNLVGVMTNSGQETYIDFVYWRNAFNEPYGYTPDPSVEFHEPGSTSYPASDSAGVLTWEFGQLDPGEERTVTVFYGIGEPEQTRIDDLDSALQGFRRAVTNLLSSNVETRAQAHAELYAELGEEYADNLVNYFGNDAGISGIGPDDVDPELLNQLGTLTDDLATPESAALYEFFDEMFGAASPDDPVSEIQSTFESYLRGTASGQSAELRINGRTIAELESAFVSDFETRRADAISTLRSENPPEDVVGDLIDLVNEKTDRIRSRQSGLTRQLGDAVSAITNGDEIRVLGGQLQARDPDGDALTFLNAGLIGERFAETSGISGTALLSGGAEVDSLVPTHGTYSGDTETCALGWLQYSAMYWTTAATWGETGPAANNIVQAAIAEGMEALGLSADAILNDFTGIEIELLTGLGNVPVTLIEFLLEDPVGSVDDFGQAVTIPSVSDVEISEDDIESGVAEGTTTVTIENQSDDPVTPSLNRDQMTLRTNGFRSVGGATPDVGSVLAPTEPIPTIPPGESRDVDVRFWIPADGGGPRIIGANELEVAASSSPYQVGGGGAIGEYDFEDTRFPDILSQDVLADLIASGESVTETVTIDGDPDRVIFNLSYGAGDLDLHLYDSQGNHVGRNYESGEFDSDIPGAVPSGPDGAGRSYEQVRIDDPDDEYEVEVIGLETSGSGSNFSSRASELSGVDAILNVSPGSIQADPNTDVERRVTVEEAADAGSLSDVTFSTEALTSPDSADEVPAGNVSVSDNNFDVGVGETEAVTLSMDVPDDLEPGTYTGDVTVESGDQEATIGLSVTVRAGPPPVVGSSPPQDLDGDGLFRDINGDGQVTIADVQIFFQNRNSAVVQNNAEFFNFDGDEPADVTIADVQALFQDYIERTE
jgi:hypothetical protein